MRLLHPQADESARRLTRRGAVRAFAAGAAPALAVACAVPGRSGGEAGRPEAPGVPRGTISFGTWAGGADKELFETMLQKFMQANPTITVEYVPADGGTDVFLEKLTTLIAGGAPPDTINTYYPWVAQFVANNILLDQSAPIARDKYDLRDFFSGPLEAFKHGGKVYALPHYAGPSVVYANKTLLDREGIAVPAGWDWDEFADISRRVTKREATPAQFAIASVNLSLNFYNAMLWEFGGDAWNPDLTESLVTQPGSLEALQYTADLYLKHRVVPTAAESQGQGDLWDAGRLAFVLNTCRCNVPNYMKITTFELTMAPLPRGKLGRITRDGPNAIGILQGSKNLDAAWHFTKWFVSADGQREFLLTRRSVPTRASIANSSAWRDALLPWESVDIYAEAMRLVRPMVYPLHWNDINKVFRDAATAVVRGEKSPKQAMEEAKPAMDTLLRQP
jgi:ABC-type glycerol-3-phosphate transport system substrate-binding protein